MATALYRTMESGLVTKRERYEQLRSALWTDRSSFDAHWKELSDWTLPRRTRFFASDRNRGDRRNQNIIDSTARFSARTLQSGLHAGLTSPARPWFKLTTQDKSLAESKSVKVWLQDVTERMLVVMADSNLYNSLPTVYGDLGVFGTGAMSLLTDREDLFRTFVYPLGSYAIATNSRGVVNVFVREYELSVRQVVEEFGVVPGSSEIDWSHLSTTIKTLWDRGMYTAPVELCWYVMPNDEADSRKIGSRFLPFTSCHIEKGEDARTGGFLRESGFRTFPIFAPRWDVTGEDSYGTDCPGMTALGDIKGLQIMQKEKARAVSKMVTPALKGSPELRTQKVSLLPGDITYVREPQHGLAAIHEVTLNLQHLREDISEQQYRIQRAFYEDLFLMIASSDQRLGAERPTAREIEERHEEKLLALGPVLDRTQDELHDPMVDRLFLIMHDAGLVPEPPEELKGVKLKVEYISILAQAQKLVGAVGIDRFILAVAPLGQAYPEVRHKINPLKVVDRYADIYDVDPDLIREDAEVEAIMQGEAAAQREAMQAQNTAALAKAGKDLGQTPLGTGSALDRLVANQEGAA